MIRFHRFACSFVLKADGVPLAVAGLTLDGLEAPSYVCPAIFGEGVFFKVLEPNSTFSHESFCSAPESPFAPSPCFRVFSVFRGPQCFIGPAALAADVGAGCFF